MARWQLDGKHHVLTGSLNSDNKAPAGSKCVGWTDCVDKLELQTYIALPQQMLLSKGMDSTERVYRLRDVWMYVCMSEWLKSVQFRFIYWVYFSRCWTESSFSLSVDLSPFSSCDPCYSLTYSCIFPSTECVERREVKDVFFCCCEGNLCNEKFYYIPDTVPRKYHLTIYPLNFSFFFLHVHKNAQCTKQLQYLFTHSNVLYLSVTLLLFQFFYPLSFWKRNTPSPALLKCPQALQRFDCVNGWECTLAHKIEQVGSLEVKVVREANIAQTSFKTRGLFPKLVV